MVGVVVLQVWYAMDGAGNEREKALVLSLAEACVEPWMCTKRMSE